MNRLALGYIDTCMVSVANIAEGPRSSSSYRASQPVTVTGIFFLSLTSTSLKPTSAESLDQLCSTRPRQIGYREIRCTALRMNAPFSGCDSTRRDGNRLATDGSVV